MTLEPQYKVGFLGRLLDMSAGAVRQRIEAGDFGAYSVPGTRGDYQVSYSGAALFFERFGSRGRLCFEPHFKGTWIAEFLGMRTVDLRTAVDDGQFGPDWLRLPGGELRIPLSGLQHYLQSISITPAKASNV